MTTPSPNGWIPLSLLQPPHPTFLHGRLDTTGPAAWIYRSLFIAYSIFIVVPLISVLVPLSWPLPARIRPLAVHPDCTSLSRAWTIRIKSQLYWAITSWGAPPAQQIDLIPESRQKLGHPGEDGYSVHALSVVVDSASEAACVGVLAMKGLPRSKVQCFWLNRQEASAEVDPSSGSDRAKEGEKVVLYFVGGGYVRGNPTQDKTTWHLCRKLGLRVLGCNYRKANHADHAFPIPLLDAVASYEYLVHDRGFAPENVVVMGQSAGGGLAWSLVAYLAALQALKGPEASRHLGVPGRVVLISPWLDLTLSHDSVNTHRQYDVLNKPQLVNAARAYMNRFEFGRRHPGLGRKTSRWTLPTKKEWYPTTLEDLLSPHAFAKLSFGHPLVSPCGPAPRSVLDLLLPSPERSRRGSISSSASDGSNDSRATLVDHADGLLATSFLIQHGTAEMLTDEARQMVQILQCHGVRVVEEQSAGDIHVEGLSKDGYEYIHRLVGGFIDTT